MTVTCPTVTVTAPAPPAPPPTTPANIICYNFSAAPSSTVPSTVNVIGMWRNDGGTAGTFTPKVSFNGAPGLALDQAQTLQPGATYSPGPVGIQNVSPGTYTVCPVPN